MNANRNADNGVTDMSPEELPLQTLLFERREGVALVTLNRPERLNGISRQMIN